MLIVWLLNAQPALSLPQSTVHAQRCLATNKRLLFVSEDLTVWTPSPFCCCNNTDTGSLMKIGRMLISTYPLHYTLAPSLAPPSTSHYGMWAEVWVLSKCSPKPSVHTLPSFNKQMRADRVSMCVCVSVCVPLCSRGLEVQMSSL